MGLECKVLIPVFMNVSHWRIKRKTKVEAQLILPLVRTGSVGYIAFKIVSVGNIHGFLVSS